MVVRVLRIVILTVAFPCLVSAIVYHGFGTNYTIHVFNKAGFRRQYEHDVYRYRVLGRVLLLRTYDLIRIPPQPRVSKAPAGGRVSPSTQHSGEVPNAATQASSRARAGRAKSRAPGFVQEILGPPPVSIGVLDARMDPAFYYAYVLQNTFFLVVSAILLWLCLRRQQDASWVATSHTYMVGVLLMGLTQYVVTPYDTLSYSLLLLSFLLIVRPFRFRFPLLMLVMVVGTLTRETSALTLSFYAAYHYRDLLARKRKQLLQLLLLVTAFTATYVSLRVHYGTAQGLYESLLLRVNFTHFYNVIGILALPVMSYLLCAGTRNLRRCLVFLLAALPYLVGMLLIAMTWEIRLWVPVWLGLLLLARDVASRQARRPGLRDSVGTPAESLAVP